MRAWHGTGQAGTAHQAEQSLGAGTWDTLAAFVEERVEAARPGQGLPKFIVNAEGRRQCWHVPRDRSRAQCGWMWAAYERGIRQEQITDGVWKGRTCFKFDGRVG